MIINEKSLDIIGLMALGIIVISLIYFGMRLTGNVTNTAIINVTIEKNANIKFSLSDINFGLGSVDNLKQNATIDTLGNVIDGNWTPTVGGLRLENLGNVNVSLQLKSGKTASQFLGGTNPSYQYRVSNKDGENQSCYGGVNLDSWYDVNTTGYGSIICDNFPSLDSNDEIDINIRLIIPSDSVRGFQTDSITATGTANY